MKRKPTTQHKLVKNVEGTRLEISKAGIKVGLKKPLSFWQLCILLILLFILIGGLQMFIKDLTWLGLLSFWVPIFSKIRVMSCMKCFITLA